MTPTHAPEQELASAYATLRRGLLASIRYKVRDAQVAEDLLQDVFVKAVKAVREGRAPENLAAWLHQVVRTTVIDHYRAGKPDTEPLDEETAQVPIDDLERFQILATCMQPLVTSLPPLYRDAVMAADFQGQALANLAQEAGLLTPQSMERLIQEALRRREAADQLAGVADRPAAARSSSATRAAASRHARLYGSLMSGNRVSPSPTA